MKEPKALRLVSTKDAPRESAPGLLRCTVCEADSGVAGTSFIEIKRMPMLKGGRVTGGKDGLACLDCLSRGKVTLF